MKLLAFDTSTEACSVALWLDGNVSERFELGTRHADRILPMIESLLAEGELSLRQLDAIAFGRGPGSFTGLRIGAGVAQGLAFGADIPVIPVSSLAALAQGVEANRVIAAIDARMQQIYVGCYRRGANGLMELNGAEAVLNPDQLPLTPDDDWVGVGSGWDAYSTVLSAHCGARLRRWIPGRHPHAADIARLASVGTAIAPDQAVPVYLRDNVAVKQKID